MPAPGCLGERQGCENTLEDGLPLTTNLSSTSLEDSLMLLLYYAHNPGLPLTTNLFSTSLEDSLMLLIYYDRPGLFTRIFFFLKFWVATLNVNILMTPSQYEISPQMDFRFDLNINQSVYPLELGRVEGKVTLNLDLTAQSSGTGKGRNLHASLNLKHCLATLGTVPIS